VAVLKKKGGGAEKKAMREAVPRNQTTRCYKTGRPCQDFFLCFFFVFSLFFLCFFFVFSLFFLCFFFVFLFVQPPAGGYCLLRQARGKVPVGPAYGNGRPVSISKHCRSDTHWGASPPRHPVFLPAAKEGFARGENVCPPFLTIFQ